MRLSIFENRSWGQQLGLQTIKMSLGHIPGPVHVLTYRKRWFGDLYGACLQEGLRGATAWSKGEVELFAAFVSKLNQCVY
ncbi:MAG: hypothetical protein AAF490_14940 [Chloroflexota bacterium]